MLVVSRDAWRQIYPNAPSPVLDAFAAKGAVLEKVGLTLTRNRLAFFCANVEHECGGFTIRNLTENTGYTAERMAQVWPNRFPSAAAVRAHFGTAAGWQLHAFDEIYGNRMGNRPGTHDGSTFIGRGGPQWTGRDGYEVLERLTGLHAVEDPKQASLFEMQPEVCAAFWSWKNGNHYADNNDFLGLVKVWNGGTNGLADRKALMVGNNPIITRLANVQTAISIVNEIDAPKLAPAQDPLGNVRWIQAGLNKLAGAGLIKIAAPLETATGIYGHKTHDAVEAFQRKFNVQPIDGIAGSLTVPAIKRQLDLAGLA